MVENRSKLKLGIIGYNDGNGHPYSFSAIINGYNPVEMKTCEYPVIYDYLEKREKSEIGIEGLNITHIWTPDIERSAKIANCTFIENVVKDFRDMIDKVDAVIIARDDAESHRVISSVFLENNIKVFVDKPLCKTIEDLYFFKPYLENNLIFSTSGFRYHPMVEYLKNQPERLYVFHTFNDWFKYGIHLLEGAYAINNSKIVSVENLSRTQDDFVVFDCENGSKIIIIRTDTNKNFYGHMIDNNITINYTDNYIYFKNMLLDFKNFCLGLPTQNSYKYTLNIVEALIKAQDSKCKAVKLYTNEFE